MRLESRWGRVARGWAAATFATVTAAVSHGIAGGAPPTVFAVAVSLLLSGMVATLLTRRSLSLASAALSIGVSQLFFHGLFSSLGAPAAIGHAHGIAPGLADASASASHGAMWLAHLAAGLATIVVYRFGESAFWGIARIAALAFALLVRVLVPVVPAPSRVTRRASAVLVPRLARVQLSSMRHRGPPLAVRAA
jgi:hypothetical protein